MITLYDPAYLGTERIIKALEYRLNKEYAKAVKEVQEKLDDYLARFQKKDDTWSAWVNDVKDDKKEYKKRLKEYEKWRTGQIAVGKRWREMRQSLAEDYTHTNQIARSIAEGYMPDVYALNHNYGTFEVEKGSRVDTSYTLYDRSTVEYLLRDNPELLPHPGKDLTKRIYNALDVRWNRQQIQSVMLQSLLQGESIPKIATRLAKEVGEKNRKAAIRDARTMATGAQNAGRIDSYKRAQDMGIKMRQQWLAVHDGRTRHSHRMVDYEIREVGEMFSNGCRFPGDPSAPPAECYNCFTGNVLVSTNSEIIRSYKHKYTGELITVETAGGVKFTCTPNHPILTLGGWIAANSLHKGDYLIVTSVGNQHFTRSNPNINHIFTRLDAIHKFFEMMGRKRTCNMGVNFHGDIPTSEVEIITQKRFLRDNRNTSKLAHEDKLSLKYTNAPMVSKSTFVKHFGSVGKTTFGFIRSLSKALTFFWRSMSHAVKHGSGTITGRYARIFKPKRNNVTATAMIGGELLDGFTGSVFLDDIIDIDKRSGCTHVYNLQTENGYYFVNSSISNSKVKNNGIMAIVKNCRCSLRGLVDGLEPKARKYHNFDDIEGMTYAEWKEAKATSNPITLPEEKGEAIRNAYIAEYRRKAASVGKKKK